MSALIWLRRFFDGEGNVIKCGARFYGRRSLTLAAIATLPFIGSAHAQDMRPADLSSRPATEALSAERVKQLETKIDQLQQHVIQQGNWIGQLLYRTEDMQNRSKWEAEARLIAPEFSAEELALLNRWEISTEPLKDLPKPVPFPSAPSAGMMTPKQMTTDGPWHVYVPGDTLPKAVLTQRTRLMVNPSLQKARISIQNTSTPHPTISASNLPTPGPGQHLSTYFEFDTRHTFDGPHFWRYPNLMPAIDKTDLTSRRGLESHIFRTTLADFQPSTKMTFPFRVTTMAYPLPQSGGDASDLIRLARLIHVGLPTGDYIRDVFDYVRHKYVWGVNTLEINALDTFRAGIAGCGHINELMGVFFEVNGVRTRGAAGFNPLYRVKNPGGGHTAAEVFDGRRWSFIDSFLGVYYPGTSAEGFATSPIGNTNASVSAPPWLTDEAAETMAASPSVLTLRELFKYRIYADKSMRLPVGHMLRLRSASVRNEPYPNEKTYGMSWPLRTSDVDFDITRDLPETATIHVRARYVISKCRVSGYSETPCVDPGATASEWTTTSFTIKPRDLLSAGQSPKN